MTGKPLTIAILSIHSCPVGLLGARDTGGMNVYVRELARELGKQGHIVDVFTRTHDTKCNSLIKLGPNARLIHLKAGEEQDIHKLAIYPYIPDFCCNVENFRKHNQLHYDLLFSHYWLSGLAGKQLQNWWDVPHITMFHTLGAVKNTIGIGEDEPELRIEAERDVAQDSHHLIAATRKEKNELVRYGASSVKVSVIPCGVNLDLFHPIDKEKARQKLGIGAGKIILFVGRIEPLKGLERLLKAITLLPNGSPNRLIIIGGDEHSQEEVEKLKSLAQDLGIGDLVTFLGLVEQTELPFFYSAADLCVIPSHYESFSLVALEALACGTPVVANNVGDLQSIIRPGETGYVITGATPNRLAEKIALVFTNHTFAPLAIRNSVIRFGWSNIASALTQKFQEVVTKYSAKNTHL